MLAGYGARLVRVVAPSIIAGAWARAPVGREILARVSNARQVICAIEDGEMSRHAVRAASWLRRDVVRMRVDDGDPVETIASAGHERHTRPRPVRTALFGSVSTVS